MIREKCEVRYDEESGKQGSKKCSPLFKLLMPGPYPTPKSRLAFLKAIEWWVVRSINQNFFMEAQD